MLNRFKFLFVFVVCFLSALPASVALARVVNFGDYSVDVPGRWTIHQDKELVTLISPERDAVFFITIGLSERPHKDRIAPELAKFAHITQSNPRQNVTMTRIRDRRVVVTIIGDHSDRTSIYYSIKEAAQPSQANPFVKTKSN